MTALTACRRCAQALAKNLRIPEAVRGSREGAGDGVFLRLMALPKGRGMLSRALRLLYAPPSLAESVPGERLRSSCHEPLHLFHFGL